MVDTAWGIRTAIFLAGLGVCTPVLAGPVSDKAATVESMMASGDIVGALEASEEILAFAWDASPDIGIRQSLLVTEPAALFGIYNPRSDDKYKVGEPVLVYAEPFGFGYGSGGEGLYTIGFGVDLRVLGGNGEVLGTFPDLVQLDQTSRYKNREFQANLTYTLNGISPGRYVLETTLRDKNSTKVGTFQNTIEIIE